MVLTTGARARELTRAVRSVQAQHGPPIEIMVVSNGSDPPAVPADVRVLQLAENLGIPAGRNRGVAGTAGQVILFLDDDGWFPSPALADHLRGLFDADPRLGIVSFRIIDPDTGTSQRRHVPRLRSDPARSSPVTSFLGGGCAIRREVFERCGGLPEQFWYAHEEIDLGWRALDAGFRIYYDAAAVMYHPRVAPTRHRDFYRLHARNRAWLARRNLPWPLAVLYVADWMAISMARTRSAASLQDCLAGLMEGLRSPCGQRRPIRWRTVLQMAKLGRPPIVLPAAICWRRMASRSDALGARLLLS
ncbi:MAG: glycosyltransferase [Sporichthyaceae bacterium]|nr:glycosyltransferase [Sporichthyaceae bacterium]